MVDLKKRLELTVMPTERCNFRCVYCYEDFKIGRMKPWVREGIKQLISKRVDRHGLDYLELSWFSGEPLLAKDVVFDIAEHAANLRQAGMIGAMGGEMTTNGYLLDLDTLTKLVGLGQKSYQITLDGDAPEHNKTRRSASGVPTFEKIWSNLVAAHRSNLDFSIVLRLHIMLGNSDSLFRLAGRIIHELKDDKRFRIFVREISNLGGPTSGKIDYISRQEAQTVANKLAHDFTENGISANAGVAGLFESQVEIKEIGKSGHGPDVPRTPYICYAAKPYHFVIRPTGKIVKCTVDFHSDRNAVGELHADGTITLDGAKMDYWARGYKSGNTFELGCPAHAREPNLPNTAMRSIPALLDEA